MSLTAQRNALLAELVALWSSNGPRATRPDGVVLPRSQYEGELIRELRPLCFAAAREPLALPRKKGAKKHAKPKPAKVNPD